MADLHSSAEPTAIGMGVAAADTNDVWDLLAEQDAVEAGLLPTAVRPSGDGRFLYTTNRGDDAISVHAVHDDGASVERLTAVPCGGTWPRDIALTPDGLLLFWANQRSDTVTAFHRDPPTGHLSPAGEPLMVTEPTSVLPIGR
ncbi:lactonase family protein [Kitasatospora sp. NPDC001660]